MVHYNKKKTDTCIKMIFFRKEKHVFTHNIVVVRLTYFKTGRGNNVYLLLIDVS